MRHFFLMTLFAMSYVLMNAQELDVKSLETDVMDITARTNVRNDLNNEPCALLKVYVVDEISNASGGVVGEIVKKGTEYWIYLEEGSNSIKINPSKHLPIKILFKDYGVNGVEGKVTYVLTLVEKTSDVPSISEENIDNADQYVTQGMAYENGYNRTPINYEKAISLYQKAINLGYSGGYNALASCYLFGHGVEVNPTKAKELYSKAAEMGNPKAMYNLGFLSKDTDPVTSFLWVKKSAEKGLSEAQRILGMSYIYGNGTKVDYQEAIKWTEKAINQGNTFATVVLGNIYEKGWCVKVDKEKAFKLYLDAATKGQSTAQYNTGNCLYYGIGVKKNLQEAINWYKKSSDQNFALADKQLGNMYYGGDGVEQNYAEAFRLFTKASYAGESEAQYTLAKCYEQGIGTPQNKEQAVIWASKSAEQMNPLGLNLMGYFYHEGFGVKKDYKKAVEYFSKSAELGNMYGQYNMGMAYINGDGVKIDKDMATQYLEKSADQGCEEAQNVLKNGVKKKSSPFFDPLKSSVYVRVR